VYSSGVRRPRSEEAPGGQFEGLDTRQIVTRVDSFSCEERMTGKPADCHITK